MPVNIAVFEGRVGQEPKVFSGEGDSKVARLSIANTEKSKNAAGEKADETIWKDVVAFGPAARFVEAYVHKGAHVLAHGVLSDRTFEKEGQKHTVTEIHVIPGRGSLELLDSKPKPRSAEGLAEAVGERQKQATAPEHVQ